VGFLDRVRPLLTCLGHAARAFAVWEIGERILQESIIIEKPALRKAIAISHVIYYLAVLARHRCLPIFY